MHDNRLTVRLTNYWQKLRQEAALPPIERFSPEALNDVIGRCCIWRVEMAGKEAKKRLYTCEFAGDEVQKAVGADLTGETVFPRFPDFPAARILEKIDGVSEKGIIAADEGQIINQRNEILRFRSCLLPFGTKDGKVTHVLFGISWKAF